MPEPSPTPAPTPAAPPTAPAPGAAPLPSQLAPAFAAPQPTAPAPAPAAAPGGEQADDRGRAGGDEALRADLAREREARHAAQREIETLRAAAAATAHAGESEETARVRTEMGAALAAAQGERAQVVARLVRSTAQSVAVAAGVPPERAGAFLRHVDLAAVGYDPSTGAPDPARVQAAVDAGLVEAPEFRASAGGPRRAPVYSAAPQGATAPAPADEATTVAALLAQMQTSLGQQVSATPTV